MSESVTQKAGEEERTLSPSLGAGHLQPGCSHMCRKCLTKVFYSSCCSQFTSRNLS